MKSQKKRLNEPQLCHAYFEVGSFILFRFNSVGLDAFPNAGSCFVWLLMIAYVLKMVNRLRLEEIVIKTRKLEFLVKEDKFLNKISHSRSTSNKKKKRSGKPRCSSDAPIRALSTELEQSSG